MTSFYKYFFTFFSIVFFTSCNINEEKTVTYFGGKVINPKTKFVLLLSQEKVIDSLLLDEDNRFIAKYNNFKEGLYYFQHGPEHQYIYIEPQDSIMIRLNTWDFDESLVFSGKGADKSNVLIDFFLESEEEDKSYSLYSFYKLEPTNFKLKLDSILALKQLKINAFKAKNPNLSENYQLVLDIAAKYPIYNRFERYPEANRKNSQTKTYLKVNKQFYSYRENINRNRDSLMIFGAYSKYIVERLYNDVYTKEITPNKKEFIIDLLNSVNKSVHTEKLKNTFLKNMLINDFYKKSSCDIDKDAFYTFFKLSSNIEDKKHVQRLLNDIKNVSKGDNLFNFKVYDYNKTEHNIKTLTQYRNSVIYFWNPTYVNNSYLASRINYLSEKFPKITFIGIQFSSKNAQPIKGIDIKNQFYIDTISKANMFLTSKLPRTLLVNKKGVLYNGYTSINSYSINKQIQKLQKN